jgi:hypothetical protein
LTQVLTAARVMVCVFDCRGTCVLASQALSEALAVDPATLLGKPCRDLCAATGLRHEIDEWRQRAQITGREVVVRCWSRCRLGKQPIAYSLTPIIEAQGIIAIACTITHGADIRYQPLNNPSEELLSMCSECKAVRTNGRWMSIEQYLHATAGASISHGLCDQCAAAWREYR